MSEPPALTLTVFQLTLLLLLFSGAILMAFSGASYPEQLKPSEDPVELKSLYKTSSVPPLREDTRRTREMLRDSTLEALSLVAHATDNRMGHTGDEREQTLKLWELVDKYAPTAGTFCEVGVNVGHSAAIMLTASSATSFLAFDCGGKPSVYDGFRLLQRVFSHASLEFVEGNSVHTIPTYAKLHPSTSCDLIHIDGAHDGPFPKADFGAMRHFAREDGKTFVIFDDCNCDTEWCVAPLAVFKKAVIDGLIEELPAGDSYLSVPGGKKGSCLGWLRVRDATTVSEIPTSILDERNGNHLPVAQKCDF